MGGEMSMGEEPLAALLAKIAELEARLEDAERRLDGCHYAPPRRSVRDRLDRAIAELTLRLGPKAR
jgi:hypothetical protein